MFFSKTSLGNPANWSKCANETYEVIWDWQLRLTQTWQTKTQFLSDKSHKIHPISFKYLKKPTNDGSLEDTMLFSCDSSSVYSPVTYFSSPTFAAMGVDKFAEYVVATSNYTISVTRPSRKATLRRNFWWCSSAIQALADFDWSI